MFTLKDGLTEAERCKILLSKTDDPLQADYVFVNAKSIF